MEDLDPSPGSKLLQVDRSNVRDYNHQGNHVPEEDVKTVSTVELDSALEPSSIKRAVKGRGQAKHGDKDAAKKLDSKTLVDFSGSVSLSPGRHIGVENDKRMVMPQESTDLPDGGCGFNPECPMEYSIDDVKNRASTAIEQKDENGAKLEEVHVSSRKACLASRDQSSEVLEDGGWCYDSTVATLVQNTDGLIDKEYLLPQNHIVADEVIVSVLAEKVLLREDGSCCYSLTDLGAGVGQFGHALRSKLPELEYHGYDGAGNVEEFTQGYVKFADLTLPLSFEPTDWVISSEVGEHIPHQYEAQVIANIHAHNRRGVILTWAVVGQNGNAHINCHSNEYLTRIFEELGYKKNDELTAALKAQRSDHHWLMWSAMAFERVKEADNLVVKNIRQVKEHNNISAASAPHSVKQGEEPPATSDKQGDKAPPTEGDEAWETISFTSACEYNDEGIMRIHGMSGQSLDMCKAKCVEMQNCKAIDYFAETNYCNLFDTPCKSPSRSLAGSSSYRFLGKHEDGDKLLFGKIDTNRDGNIQEKEFESFRHGPLWPGM